MASHAPQMCLFVVGRNLRRDLRRASSGLTSAGGQKNPSGQIGQIIGNSLIQTVANSSPIWRGGGGQAPRLVEGWASV